MKVIILNDEKTHKSIFDERIDQKKIQSLDL